VTGVEIDSELTERVAHSSPILAWWGKSIAGRIPLRFAEQEMNMLGHDCVTVNVKPETAPHPLQG
jgi:hypothetical protein